MTDRPTPETDALLLEINEGRIYEDDGPVADFARRLERENAALREALQLLHDNLAEYQRLNHLGGYDNQDMQQARAALARKQP